jgi:hypothetical protein
MRVNAFSASGLMVVEALAGAVTAVSLPEALLLPAPPPQEARAIKDKTMRVFFMLN